MPSWLFLVLQYICSMELLRSLHTGILSTLKFMFHSGEQYVVTISNNIGLKCLKFKYKYLGYVFVLGIDHHNRIPVLSKLALKKLS